MIQDHSDSQAQAQATQREAASRPAPTGGFSFSQPLSVAPISAGIGSNYYIKFKEMLVKLYKDANSDISISLLDLDKDTERSLAYSAIVVVLSYKARPELGIAYHILMLEATGEKLPSIYETINGQQVEIWRATSDAFDEVLLAKAAEKVRRHFPQVSNIHMADGCVVPSTVNCESEAEVKPIAANAGLACTVDLNNADAHVPPLNLANMNHDSGLVADIKVMRSTITDAVSNPIRSDVVVTFSAQRNNGNNKYASPNSGDRETRVSQLSGFIDLVWNPVGGNQLANQYVHPALLAQQSQKYAARLILTDLVSNFAQSPEMILLALNTALTLRDDNNWIQAFRPVATPANEVDLTDIGALNIEANLTNIQDNNGFGERIDTKTDSFQLADLGRLVAALIQPGLIVSIDCPEVGAQSWYLAPFAAAANGNANAYGLLYNAANNLTNGNFQKYFPNGSPMFVDPNNRVHLGYWTDRHGNKRDIRAIDHIAVCNLAGDRNPQVIRDWSDTFLRTAYPLPQRLHHRKKMIQSLTGESAVFTGYAQRVTPSSQFLEALSKGIRDTGLAVRVNTPMSASDFNNQRGVGTFAQAAMLQPGQTFLAAGGPGWQPNQFHMGINGGYRF